VGLIAKLLSFVRVTRGGSSLSDAKVNPGGGDNLICEHFADSGDDSFPMPNDDVALLKTKRTGGYVTVGYLDRKNNEKATLGEKRIYSRDAAGNWIAEVWLKSNGDIVLNNEVATVTLFENGDMRHENDVATITALNTGDMTLENDNATINAFNTGQIEHTNPNGTINLAANGTTTIFNALATFTVDITGLISGVNPNGSITLTASGLSSITNSNGGISLATNGTVTINGVTIDASGNMVVPSSLTLNGKELDGHDHDINSGSSAPGPTGPNN
jgi:hypothetical protein